MQKGNSVERAVEAPPVLSKAARREASEALRPAERHLWPCRMASLAFALAQGVRWAAGAGRRALGGTGKVSSPCPPPTLTPRIAILRCGRIRRRRGHALCGKPSEAQGALNDSTRPPEVKAALGPRDLGKAIPSVF